MTTFEVYFKYIFICIVFVIMFTTVLCMNLKLLFIEILSIISIVSFSVYPINLAVMILFLCIDICIIALKLWILFNNEYYQQHKKIIDIFLASIFNVTSLIAIILSITNKSLLLILALVILLIGIMVFLNNGLLCMSCLVKRIKKLSKLKKQ